MLSHPEHLTREQQYHLVQLQSQEHRPFRLIGIGDTSLVELAASNHIIAELYYCFAMTQIACLPLTQRPDDIEPLFRHYLCKACQRLNHPVPEVGKEMFKEMMRRMWPNNVRAGQCSRTVYCRNITAGRNSKPVDARRNPGTA